MVTEEGRSVYQFRMGGVMQAADDFTDSLPCRAQKPYPDAKMPFRDEKIANKLLSAYGDGGGSELSAITQYINHMERIGGKELSDLIFCIALVEMRHLHLIGMMIESLGGNLRYWAPNRHYWSGGIVSYGETDCERLSLDIQAEQEAINGYNELLREIQRENNPALVRVGNVIGRIIEDEAVHLNLLTTAYDMNCRK